MTQSDTPRTDAQLALGPSGQWADFARELEQTLREVRSLIEPWCRAYHGDSLDQALALIDRTLEGRG